MRAYQGRNQGADQSDRFSRKIRVGRDGERYFNEWLPHARAHRFLLIVPEFSKEQWPGVEGYNYGNSVDTKGRALPREQWSFTAIEPVFGWKPVLQAYEIKAVSGGEDAQGRALVRCRRSTDVGPGALVVSGHGLSTNIIAASLEAYLVAVNKLHGAQTGPASSAFVAPKAAETP